MTRQEVREETKDVLTDEAAEEIKAEAEEQKEILKRKKMVNSKKYQANLEFWKNQFNGMIQKEEKEEVKETSNDEVS